MKIKCATQSHTLQPRIGHQVERHYAVRNNHPNLRLTYGETHNERLYLFIMNCFFKGETC